MKSYKHPKRISSLFSSIANNYDLLNTLMTFGLHQSWNKQLLQLLKPTSSLLDLCAGTGDISLHFLKQSPDNTAILLDISENMLKKAQKKSRSLSNKVSFIHGDVHNLPFTNLSVSFVSLAYGLRNLLDPEACLKEISRILKHNGRLGILELTRPQNKILEFLHHWHFKFYIRLVSKLFSKNKEAYKYLENSIYDFLSFEELNLLYAKYFKIIKTKSLLRGTATIWILEKL